MVKKIDKKIFVECLGRNADMMRIDSMVVYNFPVIIESILAIAEPILNCFFHKIVKWTRFPPIDSGLLVWRRRIVGYYFGQQQLRTSTTIGYHNWRQ